MRAPRLWLRLAVVLAALAGCGLKGDPQPPDPADPAAAAAGAGAARPGDSGAPETGL